MKFRKSNPSERRSSDDRNSLFNSKEYDVEIQNVEETQKELEAIVE